MKKAREYQKKIKKLLRGLKAASPPEVAPGLPRIRAMIELVLQADATRRRAAAAVGPLEAEYVDFNELRVSPIKDMTDILGKDMPSAREKAEMMVTVLNNVFARTGDVGLDWLAEVSKREMRRTLTELGFGPYAGAAMALMVFGLPAVPVDRTLVECLKADEYVHPDASLAEVQSFLEKLVSPRQALAAHQALRKYCEKRAKTLPKKPVVVPAPPEEEPKAAAKEAAKKTAEEAAKAQPARAKRAEKKAAASKGAKRAKKPAKAKAPPRAKRAKKSSRKK